jgi:hypothetical protein
MAFSFFKTKKPIETRRQQRDALAARLSSAEADEATAREACTVAAVEGVSDADLAKVEFAKRQAEDRVQSLASALQAFDAEIESQAGLEAAAADRKVRQATARDLQDRADRIEAALQPLLRAVKTCRADIEGARVVVGEIGMFELFQRLEAELPPAFELIATELRAYAVMTVDGRAPATLPQPEVIIPPAPPIPRQRIFALQNLKWLDPETRQLAYCERFDFRELPIELAAKALEAGIAVAPDNPRVREVKHLRRGAPPDPARCYDLDTGKVPQASENLPWDAFRRIDRGPLKAFLPAPPLNFEPAGARSVPTNSEPTDE